MAVFFIIYIHPPLHSHGLHIVPTVQILLQEQYGIMNITFGLSASLQNP